MDSVVLPQAGKLQAWFLTERAVRIAATFPELEGVASPPLPEDKSAARLRLGHVLAVVRTHVAFVPPRAGGRVRAAGLPARGLPPLRRGPRRDGDPRRPAALLEEGAGPGAAPGVRRGRPRHHGQREARLQADRLRPLPRPPPRPGPPAPHLALAERPAGLAAALPGLPPACCSSWPTPASRQPAAACATCRPSPTPTRWSPGC